MHRMSFTCLKCHGTHPAHGNLVDTVRPGLVCPQCGCFYEWSRIPHGTAVGWHTTDGSTQMVMFPHQTKE